MKRRNLIFGGSIEINGGVASSAWRQWRHRGVNSQPQRNQYRGDIGVAAAYLCVMA